MALQPAATITVPQHPLLRADRIDLQPWVDAFGVAAAIGDVAPDGTVHIVAANDRFAALFGDCPLGCRPAEGIPGPVGQTLDTLLRRGAEAGRDVEGEVESAPAGVPRHMRINVRPTVGATGQAARLVAVALDLTDDRLELAHRDRALANARSAGRAVLDRLDVAALQVSAEGVLLSLNRCAAAWLASELGTPLGRRIEAAFMGDAGRAAAALVEATAVTGDAGSAEVTWNGRRLHMAAEPVGPAGKPAAAVTLVVRDRTAASGDDRSEQRERELARCQRIASLGESTATLVHELAQPLATVAAYCRGAAARVGRRAGDDAELGEALDAACREAERAGAILQTVAGFVRASPGRTAGVHLPSAVADVSALLGADLCRAGIALSIDLPDDLPYVSADPVEVSQVFHNLIRNGMDAVAGRDAAWIEISAEPLDGAVAVTVDDSGEGFPPDLRDRLFSPFVTTKANGVGMGLSICRSIIERHGGRIAADTAPDGGARIRFTLPVEDADRVA